MKYFIDEIDGKIISLLQKDARISNTKIAENVGIAESTVRSRLDRLLKNKIIRLVAVSDPFVLGFEYAGNLKIHVDYRKVDSVIQKLKEMDEIWYAVLTTGNADIDADFIVKSRSEVRDLIYGKINKIDGVLRIDASMIIEFIKRKYTWGTVQGEKTNNMSKKG